jgi:hypothetical protein
MDSSWSVWLRQIASDVDEVIRVRKKTCDLFFLLTFFIGPIILEFLDQVAHDYHIDISQISPALRFETGVPRRPNARLRAHTPPCPDVRA